MRRLGTAVGNLLWSLWVAAVLAAVLFILFVVAMLWPVRPPGAVLTVDGVEQKAGVGTYCWGLLAARYLRRFARPGHAKPAVGGPFARPCRAAGWRRATVHPLPGSPRRSRRWSAGYIPEHPHLAPDA